VDAELVDDTANRRTEIDGLELILGVDTHLSQFTGLHLHLAQALGNLAGILLVKLQDLKLRLGDLALRL